MAPETSEGRDRAAWRLTRAQHGVVARRQLLVLGFTPDAIKYRLRVGRLRRVSQGVYAVGQSDLSPKGRWMAAVLACGKNACLSHRSAGALYGICEERNGVIEVSVRGTNESRRGGLRVRTRASLPSRDVGTLHRIPITSPVQTLIDLATELTNKYLARAVNEANVLDVIDVETLRIVPLPLTGEIVNGHEVDFLWPELRLVVETDGLRYHRTPAAQAKDAVRDQAHTAAGYARLRFTHHQVKYEPAYVKRILGETARRAA